MPGRRAVGLRRAQAIDHQAFSDRKRPRQARNASQLPPERPFLSITEVDVQLLNSRQEKAVSKVLPGNVWPAATTCPCNSILGNLLTGNVLHNQRQGASSCTHCYLMGLHMFAYVRIRLC